jgi:hypothetical protein
MDKKEIIAKIRATADQILKGSEDASAIGVALDAAIKD